VEFVRAENQLCLRDAAGQPVRDPDGDPVLECMCGNVLCGRFNPAKPFFTARGSFWSNCTTDLLARTTDVDRQARTRNRCNGEGYESVALVALRMGQTTYGLLQFNDKRKDRFTPQRIALLERLADNLAIAIAHRQGQETLRESEERYRAVVEDQTEVICRFKADGTLTFVNEVFCRLFGKTSQELLGRRYQPEVVAEDLPMIEAGLRKLSPANPVVVVENRVRAGDGTERWMQFANRAFFDTEGRWLETQAVGRDISERKLAEAVLRWSYAYNRSLIEASLDPLVTIGPDGRITDVNAATEQVTGLSRHTLIGTDFCDYFTEPEKARTGYQQVFRQGWVRDYPLDLRHRDVLSKKELKQSFHC
jgi:PAS domain S-box-containing protein